MHKKWHWYFFAFYMALFGAFCGLEVDTFVEDLPFFETSTFLLLFNVLFVLLIPPLLYSLFASVRALWEKRAARTGMLVLNSIYFHLVVLILLYKSARDIDFDFYFFWYNISVAMSVLWKLYAPWLILIVLSISAFIFFQKLAFSPIVKIIGKVPRKARFSFIALIFCSMLCQLLTLDTIRGSAAGFLYANFLSDRQLRTDYHNFYREHIRELRSESPKTVIRENAPIMGEAVFFIKQESLNGLLAGSRVTPRLLKASRDGILFQTLYANSIQSIRGYECILCGVPPNLARALVDTNSAEELKDLSCLPRIFKEHGYRTLYFFGGSRNPRIRRFAESVGFEEVLADDIVQEGDIKYKWGYREDIFYTRIHEYIQKHHANDKLFVFIDTGATNHTPFKVLDDGFLNQVPFPQPKKFEERLSNTTFVQDAYLGHFYDIFKEHYAHRGSLVAISDHAWPIPIHKNNIFNERGAYEENFLISMLFIPPSYNRQEFATGSTVTHRYSQMDIVPTILDLIGLEQNYLLGESFAPWLLASQTHTRSLPQKSKLSIQPYGGGFVSVVRYPKKYLFDVLGQNVKIFDLEKDPKEQSPTIHAVDEYVFLIADFFRNGPR